MNSRPHMQQEASEDTHAALSFYVTPASGVLPGRGLGMPHSQRLRVTFSPGTSGNLMQTATLDCLVLPCVIEGSKSADSSAGPMMCCCHVLIQGCGTHDEVAEDVMRLRDG